MKSISVFAITLAASLLLSSSALGQLDLPDKRAPKKRDRGVELKRKAGGDIVPRLQRSRNKELELPNQPVKSEPTAVAKVAASLQATEAIFLELRGERDAGGELVRAAATSLVSMGPQGLAAARSGLLSDKASIVVASSRALLLGTSSDDRKLVIGRAMRRLPKQAVAPLLEALLETCDAGEDVDLLLSFCEHRQGGMRRLAVKYLATRRVGLGSLLELVSSSRSETRELAYEMMARIEDLDTLPINERLLAGLSDSSTRVAVAASHGLSGRLKGQADPVMDELLALARLRGLDDRTGSFALLTLADAEDRLGQELVPSKESVNLLVHMRSGAPFVKAASAIALAGIGFRSEGRAEWLDLGVPHALISSVAGSVYFAEYSAVRPAALRRLETITGQRFGDEGPRWKTWWIANAKGFHSLRAILPVVLSEHDRIDVRWLDPLGGESFRLIGQRADPDGGLFLGESLRLPAGESEALMRQLVDAGVFGASRLPGMVGTPNGVEMQLEVRIGDASKAFRFGDGPAVMWAQGVIEGLRALRSGAEWQLYPGPEYKEAAAGAFWEQEAPWWAAHPDPIERQMRLAELIAGNMSLRAPQERGPLVKALEDLPKVALSPKLLEPLSERLAEEEFLGERSRRLLSLILAASAGPEGKLEDAAADRLIDLLSSNDDPRQSKELARVLSASSVAFQRSAAIDPRNAVRAVAAMVIVRRALEVEDRVLLKALLGDHSPKVEVGAILAVSEAGLVEFSEEIWSRARARGAPVRRAAIRGTGRLGGAGSLDVLRLVVLDPDPSIKFAGAEALADLADPASVTLLTQMLVGGVTAPFFVPARRGLMAIGEPAWDALLLLARDPASEAKRTAMIMLAEQQVSEVTTILLTALTEDPSDGDIARELAILTGMDFTKRPNPAGDWWAWSDSIQGTDALDWFCLAVSDLVDQGGIRGVVVETLKLEPGQLRGTGSLEGAASLVELIKANPPGHILERSLRELRRLIGRDFGSLPPPGRLRSEWCDVLLERLPVIFKRENP